VFKRLLPKKSVFFDHMEASATKAVEITKAFRALVDNLSEVEKHVAVIRELEHEADVILHETLAELQRSFITPLDRNEISKISKRLDDIIDLVEGAGQRMLHYELKTAPEPLLQLLDVLERQVGLVQQAVQGLSDLRHAEPLRKILIEIHTLENAADEILRPTIGALFRDEKDPRMIIKWKEVYEHIETATDRCEDVADQIENVLLEYA
jgi:predicted phosphate transport protein (TIGR00153 family)